MTLDPQTHPYWGQVEAPELFTHCPRCMLLLADETLQRGRRCPRCMRERATAPAMEPLAAFFPEESLPV